MVEFFKENLPLLTMVQKESPRINGSWWLEDRESNQGISDKLTMGKRPKFLFIKVLPDRVQGGAGNSSSPVTLGIDLHFIKSSSPWKSVQIRAVYREL